ncbi:hypothetical protein N657DRAFT_135173 [Parathielavia appendiculata]|uniref:Uncharacterized protein n=1 Tax=Parathielavia appendiculata TaxID=2587402 RepID=A0AAN6TUU8_9PEZI|nr:hypothetical protein N657DRAFT_135173 [Parathielavia appendiculata]
MGSKATGPSTFLCLGVDDVFAGPEPDLLTATHQRKGHPDDSVQRQNKTNISTVPNAWSLMALLVWPGAREDGTRKISLSTGGDAEDDREARLIHWLGNNTTFPLSRPDILASCIPRRRIGTTSPSDSGSSPPGRTTTTLRGRRLVISSPSICVTSKMPSTTIRTAAAHETALMDGQGLRGRWTARRVSNRAGRRSLH